MSPAAALPAAQPAVHTITPMNKRRLIIFHLRAGRILASGTAISRMPALCLGRRPPEQRLRPGLDAAFPRDDGANILVSIRYRIFAKRPRDALQQPPVADETD